MTVYSPTTSSAFVTAISSCTFGDTIILDKNTIYETTSSFTFPDKGAGTGTDADYITIITSDISSLPSKLGALPTTFNFTDPSLYRITTSEAANMPKIRAASTIAEPAISFGTGAHHWKFVGIEILDKDISVNFTYLVGTTTSAETVPTMAHHLYFDRCFVHPFEETGDVNTNYHLRSVEKGFLMNGSSFYWVQCAIQGFTGWNRYTYSGGGSGTVRLDTNAILIGSGSGNWNISKCLLEGQANNIWPGGGGTQGVPSNHTATISSPTVTSGTLSSSTDLVVDDLIAVYSTPLFNVTITDIGDPDGATPVHFFSWTVAKVLTKSGNNITFQNLTSSYNPRLFRLKFGTGVTGGTFTMTFSGQTTAAINFSTNRTTLASNVRTALENLSNLAPADILDVNGSALYVSSPTFGVEIKFASSVGDVSPSSFTVNGAGLTGSGSVTIRNEVGWSESYSNLPSEFAPQAGDNVQWRGYLPDVINVTQNIIAKHATWYADMGQQKGFGEMKAGTNILYEGNIFTGQNTGPIFETKNQSGSDPWTRVSNVTIRSNLWDTTGSAIALALTDYTNRTTQGHDYLITNNLFLNPQTGGGNPPFLGNATSGGSNISFTHNTMFMADDFVFGVGGQLYDGPETAGYSQLKNWLVRDNIMLYRHYFFHGVVDPPLTGIYSHNDMRDLWGDMTADHNVVIDNVVGDSTLNGFLSFWPSNTRVTTVAAVGFTNAPSGLDYTGNYRLTSGSTYHNAASDGSDPGVNYSTLISALGFDPFNGGAPSTPSVKLIAITM